MKRCGRLNSGPGFRCDLAPGLISREPGDCRARVMIVACTLAAFALLLSAAVASTADSSPAGPATSSSPAPAASLTTPTVNYDNGGRASGAAATTTEVPQVMQGGTATDSERAVDDSQAQANQTSPVEYDDGIIRYEHAKDPELSGPPIGSLDDFMNGGDISSPLGFEVREDKRRLKTGGEAQGLLVIEVLAGSPAARAGLHSYHQAVRNVLETAAVAGAMFFPPAVLLVPIVDQVRIGESYDLIIGVDGARVTNFLDFQDRLHEVQAGEIVYLSVVRNGERKQIQVPVPADFAGPTF